MTGPSEEYLDEVQAREQATRRGPWLLVDSNEGQGYPRPFWCVGTLGDEEGAEEVEVHTGDKGVGEFIAHAREDVPALLAEVRRLRAEVARLTPRSPLHSPAVDQLVDMVKAELENGPCWVLSAPGGQAALVGTNPAGGLWFVGVFRRATLADACGLGLLDLSRDLTPLPQYTGGTGRWAWSRDVPGQPVNLGGGAR